MYSQLCLPHCIVIYCASITTKVLQMFFQQWVGTVIGWYRKIHSNRFVLPLGRVGLLLLLLSLYFSFLNAFLFRTQSTLFL